MSSRLAWLVLVLPLASGCFLDRTGGSPDGATPALDAGPPRGDASPLDAGSGEDAGPDDGGRDGGALDAGVPPGDDGGGVDGGPEDAGSPDGGTDAGSDAGTDAGPVDAGCGAAVTSCSGGMETECRVDGVLETRPCPLGVCAAGGVRCASPVPSNVAASFVDSGAPARNLTGGTFDTDDCTGGTVVAQTGAPELCVLSVSTVGLAAGETIRVEGPRPLVIVASGAVTLDGVIDVSARRTVPGAGGGAGGVRSSTSGGGPRGGATGGPTPGNEDGGGGGGGLCGAGGTGGTGEVIPGGAGGAARTGWDLSPLEGGSGGGWGRGTDVGLDTSANGGAGGGALQIFSAVSITLNGTILAAGGGANPGRTHFNSSLNYGAGGGGGSGGAVLLEAPVMTFGASARISTTGGGGSGAASFSDGEPGQDGRVATGRANGGASGGTTFGAAGGASGADGTFAGLDGATNTGSNANGGGGGGGVGCVLVRTRAGTVPSGAGGFSPNAAPALRALVIRTD